MEQSSLSVEEAMYNSLRLQVIMNGVWDIEDALEKNVDLQINLEDKLLMDGTFTEEVLLDLINEFYDFNEFGGLTTDFVSNLMEMLMPTMYVRFKFINEVQGEMLKKACERIIEKRQKVVEDMNYDPESKLRSYLNG